MTDAAIQRVERQHDAAVDRLSDLLSIASVSTDPYYRNDMDHAAKWLVRTLEELKLDAQMLATDGGPPVVVAHSRERHVANPDAPRVLYYGHYDVQPPDPVDQWDSPPFTPTVRDGRLYARGALDNKGQLTTILEALRACMSADGELPAPVTLLIEGEEECGSVHLPAFIEKHKDLLAADVCVISDTNMWDADTPAITYALRGLVYFDVKLHGPNRDLHSGVYGGTLANPATLLARALGKLVDDQNRIAIPDFYGDVDDVSDEEMQQWEKLGFDEQAYFGEVDAQPFGENGYSTLERRWTRPSCDVNGLYGGYQGHGAKTVIPSFAGAKVSFRIPPSMCPKRVAKQFTDWLEARDVGDLRWEIASHGEAAPVCVPIDSPYIAAARDAIEKSIGKPPAMVREGATIPVVPDIKRILGIDTLLVGFGLEQDRIHSPNESFGLDRLLLGSKTHVHLLDRLAQLK